MLLPAASSNVFWKHASKELAPIETRYIERDTVEILRSFVHRRRWISRVWVVQELALAQDVCVVCGAHRISWDRLVWISKLVEDGRWQRRCLLKESVPQRFGISPLMLSNKRNQSQRMLKDLQNLAAISEEEMNLLFLVPTFLSRLAFNLRGFLMVMWLKSLNGCRGQQATEKQDKVVFSLGIISQLARSANVELRIKLPLPLYSPGEARTWSCELLLQNNFLEVLGAVESRLKRQMKDLLSWVPDWSYPYAEDGLVKISNTAFDASKTIAKRKNSPKVVKNGSLFLRGLCVGSITALASWVRDTELSSMIGTWKFWKLALSLTSTYQPLGLFSVEVEAFWRTMIFDTQRRQYSASSSPSKAFRVWFMDSLAARYYRPELQDIVQQSQKIRGNGRDRQPAK
jgi:hypothetical protein